MLCCHEHTCLRLMKIGLLGAAVVAGVATAAVWIRRRKHLPSLSQWHPREFVCDLASATREVEITRKRYGSNRAAAVSVRGAVFHVPNGNAWRVLFGPKPWKTDKQYRARAVSTLVVLNWSSLVPTFVGGGVSTSETSCPHKALNRELSEELGHDAASAFAFLPRHYQFSLVQRSKRGKRVCEWSTTTPSPFETLTFTSACSVDSSISSDQLSCTRCTALPACRCVWKPQTTSPTCLQEAGTW